MSEAKTFAVIFLALSIFSFALTIALIIDGGFKNWFWELVGVCFTIGFAYLAELFDKKEDNGDDESSKDSYNADDDFADSSPSILGGHEDE